MENSNIKKNNPHTLLLVFILILLLVIAAVSVLNTYFLFSINTKLSLLPKMDFSGVQDSLQKIEDTLDIRMWDLLK